MTARHARLASAVADAILAQNFTQANVARMSGVSQSMISAALCGKYNLKEEKWRMICETLAIDYDATIADPEPEVIPESPVLPMLDPAEGQEEPESIDDENKYVMDVVSRYLARKLSEDIRHGTDLSLEELYHLLAMCKHAKELAEK